MSAAPGEHADSSPAPVFVRAEDARASAHTGPERWVVAPLRMRAWAWLFDLAVVGVITTVLMLPAWAFVADAGPLSDDAGLWASITGSSSTTDLLITTLADIVAIVVWVFYNGLLTSREGERHGQTLGKELLHVRALRENADPMDRREAWVRAAVMPTMLVAPSVIGNALDPLLGTTPLLSNAADVIEIVGIGVLFAFALGRSDRREPIDRVTRTIVVRERPVGQRAPDAPAPYSGSLPIEHREHAGDTWPLAALMTVLLTANVVSTLWP